MNSKSIFVEVQTIGAANRGEVEELWLALQEQCHCPFSRQWVWLQAWLSSLPGNIACYLVQVKRRNAVIGLGVLGARRRHPLVPGIWRNGSLTATGVPRLDCITVEHNSFLARADDEAEVIRAILTELKMGKLPFGSIQFPAVGTATHMMLADNARCLGLRLHVNAISRFYWMNLRAEPGQEADVLMSFSSNTRYQIRKAIKLYEASDGVVRLVAASSTEQALKFFNELKILHQTYWNRRGERGAFSHEFFRQMHGSLIRDGQLGVDFDVLKISAGEKDIGYIYNLLVGDRVYTYQSGFNYEDDNRLKPGLVSHLMALRYYKDKNAEVYDFLAGESQYKRSMSSDTGQMVTLSIRRARIEADSAHFWRKVATRARRVLVDIRPSMDG